MHVSDVTDRVLTHLREAGDYPTNPNLNAACVVAFFPGGCPDSAPEGWPHDTVDYEDPHATTICPGCLDSWREDHLVSAPVTVPAGTPLTLRFPWVAAQLAPTTPGDGSPADTDPVPADTSA
ncbi:hypothetical protein Ga0074812_14929 [Parafrankia irregularis]|uniref:Uncharacterized protein n=1 Tax=Parafrankia irregularis TaxID=795642 RepID=A0A0S4QZ71_9ACTN|nr:MULTISPECIES: hypothetical protein [Frankiaceae]KPM50309.1 hypothetical protein ACG83_40945 [Frankia sp. R43]MBE3204711.1 hypothetical protein [Parafrankia sp. CH37]CUU60885.1 hypothetical protein Ga0074812_14929 [Parafrankia irregularis]